MKADSKKKRTASTLVVKTDDVAELAATRGEKIARHAATAAEVQAAAAMQPWAKHAFADVDLCTLIEKIREQTNAMHKGDMKEIEAMLFAQSLTLQATFTALSRRAAANSGEHMGATDTYLRLALKAQGQCRATLETLANIKNPRPMAFVKQANIANGPQQVNNGMYATTPSHTHAGDVASSPNKLLEGQQDEPLDISKAKTPGSVDTELETVGAIDRAKVGRR